MSRIDDLIKELCPEGVDFRPVADIFEMRNGYTPSKANTSNWTNGTVPWFRMEDVRSNGRVLDDAIQHIPTSAVKGGRLFPANSIIVATSATIGEHALITVPFISNQRFTALWLKPDFVQLLDVKFVFYYCFVLDDWCRSNITTSSFAAVDMSAFKRFNFPLPPLEIQQEIVRILDTFTELEAELEAELEVRKKQYAYYRDKLLTFPEGGVRRVPLGEICVVKTGQMINKVDIQENPGEYPVINSGREPLGLYGKFNTENDPIGITSRGAGVGSVTWCDGRFFRGNLNYSASIKDPDFLSVRFLYHLLLQSQSQIQALATYDGIPALNKINLEKLNIPIPSLEEQDRIVNILDSFDALVNDLSTGLPAELSARRKQYEYYRDKLLTFEESPS